VPPKVKVPALLTISEAADLLNVSKVTIRRWTNDGRLRCSRVGSRKERRFLEADLLDLVSNLQQADNKIPSRLVEPKGAHRCVLCDSSQQGWEAVVREIISHLTAGAHVTFIGDAARKKRLADAFLNFNLNLATPIKSGELSQLSVDESYLISGTFSGSRAAAFVESTILDAHARGFERTLFVGWSDWLTDGNNEHNELLAIEVVDYERRLDPMLERYPQATLLCPYKVAELPPETLVELLSHHPQLQLPSQVGKGLYSRAIARPSVTAGAPQQL
jgi:excisionase family DNA binding protein|tara:strand:+ start:533 stop:1357 length:825 start_codon:yes stop_codon:yes gene_type:complete